MFETLRKFFRFCDKENRNKFYGSIAVGVVNAIFMALRIAAVAVMLQGLIGTVIDGKPFEVKTIYISLGIMLVSILGSVITKKNTAMWQCEGGYRTCANKRIEIAEHLRYLPMGYFNSNSLGEITSVTTNTMEAMGDVATRAVMMVLQGLLDTAFVVVMILIFDWRIGLVALAGFLLFEFVNIFMRLSVKSISADKIKVDAAEVGKILEFVQGIAEVKAYNLAVQRQSELNKVIDKRIKTLIKMEMRCIPVSNVQSFVAKLTGVAIMLASIYFYLAGSMNLADCATMLVCSFMLFTTLEAGGNYSALLRTINLSVAKANAILSLPTMDIEGKDFDALDVEHTQLDAQDVDFAYDKKKIIDGVSLKIPAHTTTAFVGPSGGGKTTFCHLLSRFWDVNSGKITLNGTDVKEYSMDSLMQNFSFVFQSVYLFHDTIANNIRFGNPEASMDKVIEAAKKACCHDFISSLPKGYDTVIGEGGASLSGGERQRISIARAIMKDSPIIILDEATANVDPENERDLMDAVKELTKEKTVIMIAHRLKTVRNADQIVVIDKGKIAEKGSHEELLSKGGIYSRFIDSRKEAVSWKL
ncbi:MAG: ABC transporter ATP-binding protein/permease [Treponemataceae bacterium]|nr:ABC transporter ATP-binding protein/permease [Treponemataceae bacterium]